MVVTDGGNSSQQLQFGGRASSSSVVVTGKNSSSVVGPAAPVWSRGRAGAVQVDKLAKLVGTPFTLKERLKQVRATLRASAVQ